VEVSPEEVQPEEDAVVVGLPHSEVETFDNLENLIKSRLMPARRGILVLVNGDRVPVRELQPQRALLDLQTLPETDLTKGALRVGMMGGRLMPVLVAPGTAKFYINLQHSSDINLF